MQSWWYGRSQNFWEAYLCHGVHPKFKEAYAYGVFYSHRIGLAIMLSRRRSIPLYTVK